ncbi:MAG: hypothetical protein OHK0046_42500 [Anaerolineae bacterium]
MIGTSSVDLLGIASEWVATLALDELLDKMLSHLNSIIGYDSASVFTTVDENSLRVCEARGYERWVNLEAVQTLTVNIGQMSFLQPVRFGQSVLIEDAALLQDRPLAWRHARSFLAIPLVVDEGLYGLFTLERTEPHTYTHKHQRLAQELASWAAIALRNAYTYQEAQNMSRALVDVHETERDSIANLLHDEIANALSLVRKSLLRTAKTLPHEERELLHLDINVVGEVAEDVRNLSHNLGALTVIRQFNLVEALHVLVDNYTRQSGVSVNLPPLQLDDTLLNEEIKLTVFRMVQEALANVDRHSQAEEVTISLEITACTLMVQVQDGGRGFDTHQRPNGIGLTGMRQRVAMLNGQFHLESIPGQGTRLRASIPLPKRPAARLSAPLTGRALSNLVAFARLFGYVRYFYPGQSASAVDWEMLAVEGTQLVESTTDTDTLITQLRTLFSPVAPEVLIFAQAGPHPVYTPAQPQTEVPLITAWIHHGFGTGISFANTRFQDETNWLQQMSRLRQEYGSIEEIRRYLSECVIHPADDPLPFMPHPDEPAYLVLNEEVACLLPMALYTTAAQASPPNSVGQIFTSNSERSLRLASIIILWNVFQHFYLYFPQDAEDWSKVLPQALQAASESTDDASFHAILQRMMVRLEDGAARVRKSGQKTNYAPPFIWDWIEGQLVITAVMGSNALQPGDVVISIDQKPVQEAVAAVEKNIAGATPAYRRHRALRALWRGAQMSTLTLHVQRQDDRQMTITLPRTVHNAALTLHTEPRPRENVTQIMPQIMYVDLTRVTKAQFVNTLPLLEMARGVIFDLRGFPKNNIGVLSLAIELLIEHPVQSMRWQLSNIAYPDRQNAAFETLSETLHPHPFRLMGTTVFLTDVRVMGQTENMLSIVSYYELAAIIGQSTAGISGSTDTFTLPSGYDVFWTAMRALKQDNTPHHGVGIQPTMPVTRTLTGVRAEQDEILNAALHYIQERA